jgi:hypothetical protein
MKKILITNNSQFVSEDYDIIYTDSPYVIEHHSRAIYLDTLLEKELSNKVKDICKKGSLLNKELIESFFPKYQNRDIELIDIRSEYTNIYINIIKLCNLINLYPDDEIIISITSDELYDYSSIRAVDRYVNIYYLITKLSKIKNIKLVCKNFKLGEPDQKHKPINSWFLRLINLDKKVLTFNLKKKFKLIKPQSKKVFIYNYSSIIREIEPYLYDMGISCIKMPEINTSGYEIENILDEKKLNDILDKTFENNTLENIFKLTIFEIYKKIIKKHLEKEIFAKKYVSKLDKSIRVILTNSLDVFDSLILSKQLQDNGFKIIEAMHGMGKSYLRKSDIVNHQSFTINALLCFNESEKKLFKDYDPKFKAYLISSVQQTKNIRLKKLQRFYVNKMLKISDQKNVFYPSCDYPYNNNKNYVGSQSDKGTYNFEKKMVTLLSKINKRSIYKTYPSRCFIDQDTLIEYAERFSNIKVISEKFDFRYVNTIGDIFILGHLGGASTVMWMLGLNRPIIYLHTNKFRHINPDAQNIVKKIFITVDIDKDDWENDLKNLLNKPFKELIEMWQAKQVYRDQFDEEWLMGTNLHAGKLGAKYINRFISENAKNI